MAAPMSADQQVAQFRKFGLKVSERPGWRDNNRNHVGSWGNVRGLIMHHTASEISHEAMEAYLFRGDPNRDLPGPLCQWALRRDGTVVMIGNGRANHAGKGDRDVYNAVVAESYGDYPPRPDKDEFDGNAVYYGIEVQYSGTKPPVQAQYDAMVKMAAAVCKYHGWSAKSVIAHKEHTSRKPDPGHVDMAQFRRDVQALISKGGSVSNPTAEKLIAQLKKRVANQKKKIRNLRRRLRGK